MEKVSSPHFARLPPFPIKDFTQVMDGLNKYTSWTVYPENLGRCISSAASILSQSCRISSAERTMINKLIREAIPSSFEKAVEDPCQTRWGDSVQADIYYAAIQLVDLLVQRLEELWALRDVSESDQLNAVEEDLCTLYEAWHRLCDPHLPFHMRNKDSEVPTAKAEEYPQEFAVPIVPARQARPSPSDSSTSAEEIAAPEYMWLANLLNCFGAKGGFALVFQVLQMPQISYILVDTLLTPILKALEYLTATTLDASVEPMHLLLQRMMVQLEESPELLTDQGRDRMFTSASGSLSRINRLLAVALSIEEADREVGQVQRHFVLCLLAQSSFSKHLTAVRETNTLLKRAVDIRAEDKGRSMKVNVEWLQEHDIVKQLLRANLHQKQYVDQVQKVLKNLTIEGGLQEDHLELLWNLTEKVDTFEAVKNNVYAMLGDLAQDFDGNQMDLLFNKFEACSSLSSRQMDTMKVMNLVQQLAVSDSKGAMATRILGLLWEMVMDPEAPPETSRSPTLVEAICHYGWAHAWPYMQRCVHKVAANDNAPTALHTLRRLCERLPTDLPRPGGMLNEETIQKLEADCHLQEVVVSSFEAFMGDVVDVERQDPTAHTTEAGTGRLRFQMIEYVQFLYSFVRSQSTVLPVQVYERLWHCWVELPKTLWILELGYQWFSSCAQCMSPDDAACLLQGSMTSIDSISATPAALQCFLTYLREVGLADNKLVLQPIQDKTDPQYPLEHLLTEDLDLTGLELMWKLAMEAENLEVAANAGSALVQLHLRLGPLLQHQQASVRAAFIQSVLEKLAAANKALRAAAAQQSVEQQWAVHALPEVRRMGMHAARSLTLLQDLMISCQGRRMPREVAHAASYQGPNMRLDVQLQGQAKLAVPGRVRLSVHSNSYVGQLRRQIASQVGISASQLRLLHGGRELNNDSKLVREARVLDGAVLQVMSTPISLEYTQLPQDTVAHGAASPAALLSMQADLYTILLSLADDSQYPITRMNAGRLLGMLPTWSELPGALRAAIMHPHAAAELQHILSLQGPGATSGPGRARLLYLLEAICAVLCPMVATDAEPSAEALSHSFVRGGCIQVMLDAVTQATQTPSHEMLVDTETLRSLNGMCQQLLLQLTGIIRSTAIANADAASSQSFADTAMQTSPTGLTAQEAQGDVPAEAHNPTQTDTSMLIKMATFFMSLAHNAAQGWGADNTPSAGLEHLVADRDVTLHHDAIHAIRDLLDFSSPILPLLLEDTSFAGELSKALCLDLMSPRHEAIRTSTAKLVEGLTSVSEGHAWVLSLLLMCVDASDFYPNSCGEFYSVLSQLLSSNLSAVPRESLHLRLTSLVEQSATFEAADARDLRLQGKLQLILALMRALGRFSFEDLCTGHGSLVHRLLTDYLFPEAYAVHKMMLQPDAQLANLEAGTLYAAMNPRCNTPTCRKAAFDLLVELMLHDSSNLIQGLDLLMDLHYNLGHPGILNSYEYSAAGPNIARNAEGFVGLRNGSATCYMNAVFQQLFMTPGVRMALLAEPEEPEAARKESVFYQMQAAFSNLALSRSQAFKPSGIWHAFKDYDGEPVNVREHQDAQEFLTRLQDLIDQHLRDCKRPPIMQAQFGGTVTTQIVCRSVPYRSEKDEDFIQVGLDVRGKHDLEESLNFYVQSELMEGENQYLCEEAGKKVDAVKGICFKTLPNTLCIHLKRFEYDYVQMTRWKIKDRFEFPLQLNMYKYTKAAADAREAAESGLESTPASSAAEAAASAGCSYELRGIVVHSGTANAGHYYSYIKAREEPGLNCAGQWFCFDDTSVEAWDISNLERDCFGGKHTPDTGYYGSKIQEVERPNSAYLLFYDRIANDTCQHAATATAEDVAQALTGSQPAQAVQPAHSHRSGRMSIVPIPAVEASMPSIYQHVMSSNLRILCRTNLLDLDYFAFMLLLLEGDSGAASHKVQLLPAAVKVRRTGAASSPSARSPSLAPPIASSSLEERSSRSSASMGVDGSAVTGPASNSTAASDRSASPTRRILDLCMLFLLRVYLRSHATLRVDQASWRSALRSALEHDPHARRSLLDVASRADCPADSAYEDFEGESLDFCTLYLIRSDQADVRQCMAELIVLALKGAAQYDEASPALDEEGQQATEPGSATVACETILNKLKRGLRSEQQLQAAPGSASYAKRPPFMDVFPVLAEYAALGQAQAAHLVRLGFMTPAVKAAESYLDAMRLSQATWHEVLACFQLLAHIGRRWETREDVPNPYRIHGLPMTVKQEVRSRLSSPALAPVLLSTRFLCDDACRSLLKFLQWENQTFSFHAICYALDNALHDIDLFHFTTELADAVSIQDDFVTGRMTILMYGRDANNPTRNHLQGFAQAMLLNMTDLRRYAMLALLVAMADSNPEVEQAILAVSCQWGQLYQWLSTRSATDMMIYPNVVLSNETFDGVLRTIQHWADVTDPHTEGADAEVDPAEDEGVVEADEDDFSPASSPRQ